MYGLPKVHKPKPIPLRPILSMVGSAQHELARWLAEVIRPVLHRYSSNVVKDSFSFCADLQDYGHVSDSAFMCSFDVVSLFTNVRIDETIQICLDTLYRSDIKPPSISEGVLKKLLLKATRGVEFSYNDKMYRQKDGVAMGSPFVQNFSEAKFGVNSAPAKKLKVNLTLPLEVDQTTTMYS